MLVAASTRIGKPEIFNTDHGSQFSGAAFTVLPAPMPYLLEHVSTCRRGRSGCCARFENPANRTAPMPWRGRTLLAFHHVNNTDDATMHITLGQSDAVAFCNVSKISQAQGWRMVSARSFASSRVHLILGACRLCTHLITLEL